MPREEPAPSTGSRGAASVQVVRKAGVMAVVEQGGEIRAGQPISVLLPDAPHQPLEPV